MREGVIQPPVEKRLRFAECPIPCFAGEDAETRRSVRASGLCGVGVPGAQRLGGGWRGRLLVLQGAGRKDTPTRSRNRCPHASCRHPRLALPVSSGLGCLAVCPVPRILFSPIGTVFALRRPRRQRAAARRGGGRGAGSPPGPGPHLCSRPCPPSSFPSRDSSLRRSQMPPRPGMTGIPRRSWQTGALLAQVPGPRPALQGRESHRASWSRGRPPAHNQEAASPVSSNWFPGSLRTLKLFPVPRLPRCEALTASLPVEFSGWTALRAPYLGAGSWPRSPPGERWWSSSDLGPPWAAARLGQPAAWGAPRSASVSPRPRGQCGSFESRESML